MTLLEHGVMLATEGMDSTVRPAATVLIDRTILAAAQLDTDVDTVRLWHLTESLDVIDQADITGHSVTALTATAGGALLVTAGDGGGYARGVTTSPLTLGPPSSFGGSFSTRLWLDYATAPVTHDNGNVTFINSTETLTLAPDGNLVGRGAHSVAALPIGAWPAPGGGVHVVTEYGQAHHVATDGTTTDLGGFPGADPWWWVWAATDPASGEWWATTDADDGTPTAYGTNGDVAPYGVGGINYADSSGMSAPLTDGGTLNVHLRWAADGYVWHILHLTAQGDATYAESPLVGTTTLQAGSVTLAESDGRWVAAILSLPEFTSDSAVLQVLTGTLAATTYDGILHIDTIDHPYWLVGTADPDMAYRLHIGGLVEILAGQDDQATHRLRVCDGTDWPVAAYMRPE